MKRRIFIKSKAIALGCFLSLGLVFAFAACGSIYETGGSTENASQGLEYELSADNSYYTLTGLGACLDESVVIPSALNGKPVKVIAENAFKNCSEIKEITIPDSVTRIGKEAFLSCAELQKVRRKYI